jgi:HEPN domain-containing protein
MKAVLALDDVAYPWTHDLGALADPLTGNASLALAARNAVPLSRFAVAARYQGEIAPSQEEAREALDTARHLYDIVAQALAPDDDDDPVG